MHYPDCSSRESPGYSGKKKKSLMRVCFLLDLPEQNPNSEATAKPRLLQGETERERLRREAQEHRRRVADVSTSVISSCSWNNGF